MFIKVKSLTGREIEVDVDKETHIQRIKELIEEKAGVPPIQQRLIFGGKQMADDKISADYSLKSGDTLHLVLALRGGDF